MEIGENKFFVGEINQKNLKNYHLSIELHPNKIQYSILDTINLKYVFLKNISAYSENELVTILNKEKFIKENFSSCSIAYDYFPHTIIPKEIYQLRYERKYLEFIEEDINSIKNDNLDIIDSKIVYSLPNSIDNFIKKIQPKIIEKHNISIKIQYILEQYSESKQRKVFIFYSKKYINLLLFDCNKLIFNNFFKIHSKTDVLYYILYTYDLFKLDTNKHALHIYGNITNDSEIYLLVRDYIKNLIFGKKNRKDLFSPLLEKINSHNYNTIFNQIFCV
ncbi:MAG: hypothetical protein CMP51_01615 [Flavobacteriales bacterium]|nr:hypothetical protein [Flavobacteriales bacterium]|tara:strand:- start:1159 stop:1989 length:831 start_codon:yes stop_codon:yes gene_type:complete